VNELNRKKEPTFRISSGLKNLIGKELITDEYIAIFELVKNSFDAKAKKVTIIFENIHGLNGKILIIDNGKGMDFEDIENKWLFVAYSAKSDGSEEGEILNPDGEIDYREKIEKKRYYAGAKGVGRFSCDRLGSKLNLVTIKNKPDARIENIIVDWERFEQNPKEEFVDIDIQHRVLEGHNYPIMHGTILEITNLRDVWTRKKLLYLKKSLEKLINPNQQNVDDFCIEIIAKEEIANDNLNEHERDKVNGFVENKIFETLNLKTTSLETELTSDGMYILTTVRDRGELIYKIREQNTYELSEIKIHLFYLNRSAKISFKKAMGIDSVTYGSVFMYKNGFRVYPFGEEGEDTLKLDKRKVQGYARFLGTRELIGRIEINGDNEQLKETTSRDGGLVRNNSYEQLVDFFYEYALKRLEKYVVEVIRWGEPYKINKDDEEFQPALNPSDVKEDIIGIVKTLSRSSNLLEVEYNDNFLEILKENQMGSATNLIQNLSVKAMQLNDIELQKEVKKTEEKFKVLNSERRELIQEVENKENKLREVEKKLEETTSQNLFYKQVTPTDTKEIISLQHQINHSTVRIGKNLDNLKSAILRGETQEAIFDFINKISIENSKVSTIAKFVTKANFNLTSRSITKDLVQFVNEYITNVYQEYRHLKINNQQLNIQIKNKGETFITTFRPLELIIIIDNLLSNSSKAAAKNVTIEWNRRTDKIIEFIVADDGRGIKPDIIDRIFEFGFTTTDGSGLGLYHVKELIERMNGYISVTKNLIWGSEFTLGVRK
jgi:hypothetical protein